MKILSVTCVTSFSVETDEDEYNEYTRYGENCWMVRMGESDETVYDCEELEKLYQEHQKNQDPVCRNKNCAFQGTYLIGGICPICLNGVNHENKI